MSYKRAKDYFIIYYKLCITLASGPLAPARARTLRPIRPEIIWIISTGLHKGFLNL